MILDDLGRVLGGFVGSWGVFWGGLEGSCMDHGGSWGILGASWEILEGFWRVFEESCMEDLEGILEGS